MFNQTLDKKIQKGFTLLEIMVVVVILGILASLVAPQILGRADDARITKAKADITSLETALDLYQLDNHQFPSTNQGIQALVSKPSDEPVPQNYKQGGYIKSLPKDPWGNEYLYLQPGIHNVNYDLYTLGADGIDGGTGSNADIGNWTNDNKS
ncbi:MAG: type II secretion system major pseudopilin GspG [Gammaproteobacteria bacterium]|nr:type II secretion system major pseudopilin GspG [Gammaproteobacteria bacterium]